MGLIGGYFGVGTLFYASLKKRFFWSKFWRGVFIFFTLFPIIIYRERFFEGSFFMEGEFCATEFIEKGGGQEFIFSPFGCGGGNHLLGPNLYFVGVKNL